MKAFVDRPVKPSKMIRKCAALSGQSVDDPELTCTHGHSPIGRTDTEPCQEPAVWGWSRSELYCRKHRAEHFEKVKNSSQHYDLKAPAWMHSVWCATMIMHEIALLTSGEIRSYSLVLLYHDILEDTVAGLPNWINDQKIIDLLKHMTFSGGSKQEMQEIWDKPKEVRLMKLFDKVSNLLDGAWMNEEKATAYKEYVHRLADDVEKNYGELNIVRIARTLTK